MWQRLAGIWQGLLSKRDGLYQQGDKYPIRPRLLPFNAPTADQDPWRIHWQKQNQEWRTKPEISRERQAQLAGRLTVPHYEYPFKGMVLSRADVEWLLANHHGGQGPVQWDDAKDWRREGLDLRGAILCGEDLRGLPLTRLFARYADLQRVRLFDAHLEVADFVGVNLRHADLSFAYLEQANFAGAWMERVVPVNFCKCAGG